MKKVLSYPATLSMTPEGFVITPRVNLHHISGKRVDSIILEDIAEMTTSIPVTAYLAALTGPVDVTYTDTNTLHFIQSIKILEK